MHVRKVVLPHVAGGNVKCDGCLESSNSTLGNLPHRNKDPDKEGLMCKNIIVDAVILTVAHHLLNSLSLTFGEIPVLELEFHLPNLGISKLLLGYGHSSGFPPIRCTQ